MKMRKMLCVIFALCLVLATLVGCSSGGASSGGTAPDSSAPASSDGGSEPTDSGETFHFNVSLSTPEQHSVVLVEVLDRIQEKSNGRIEMTYYYSWSLTAVNTIIDDFNAGIVDIGVHSVENDTLFPYSNLITNTPFMGLTMGETAVNFDEMFDEYPVFEEEFAKNGLVYWASHPINVSQLYFVGDTPARTPADLNGQRIATNLLMLQEFINENGGAGVSFSVPELSTLVNTGVVDGVIQQPGVMTSFGAIDFLNSATIFGEEGILSAMMAFSFAEDKWNSMPADLQQLFIDEAEYLRDGMIEFMEDLNGPVDKGLLENTTAIELTDADIQVWKDSFGDIADKHVEGLIGRGCDQAKEIYDIVKEKGAA